MSYRIRRTDSNHAEIRDGLRKWGLAVLDIHDLGHGAPDLLVLVGGVGLVLLEVKQPGEKLTPAEEKFHRDWEAHGGYIAVVHSLEEAKLAC